jgi:hypothetical protein
MEKFNKDTNKWEIIKEESKYVKTQTDNEQNLLLASILLFGILIMYTFNDFFEQKIKSRTLHKGETVYKYQCVEEYSTSFFSSQCLINKCIKTTVSSENELTKTIVNNEFCDNQPIK